MASDDRQETADDIIESMERFASRHWMHDEGQNVREFAARLKAALKREKAAIEADALAVGGIVEAARHTPGNAAAMREALEMIHDKVNGLDEECGVDPVEIRDLAKAALSAPARNCDVMSRSICAKHFSTTYEGNRDGLCDVQTEREKNIHLYYIEFNKWLFAPAAERKGE